MAMVKVAQLSVDHRTAALTSLHDHCMIISYVGLYGYGKSGTVVSRPSHSSPNVTA